jgi:hypothetical protein
MSAEGKLIFRKNGGRRPTLQREVYCRSVGTKRRFF